MEMNEMTKVFTSEKFGSVRILEENGKVLFVGSDVAKALGYSKPHNAVSTHCRCALKRGIPHPQNNSISQEVTMITEGDMYRLITHSKLPEAQKFESWVFDEVLPSIRKSGSYAIPQTYADALMLAAEQAKTIELMQPKADFYDTVASSESLLSMADVAKVLDMGIGRNKLYKLLRDRGILQNTNVPYQRFVDAGYFKLVESTYVAGENQVVATTTYVRQKGVDYIRKLLTTGEY